MTTKVPPQLRGKVWHSTSIENAKSIVGCGAILAEPELSETKRWGSATQLFVRSIGGISLFDFRLPNSHSSGLLSRFVPCKVDLIRTVWFEIDLSKLGSSFLSAEDTRLRWINAGMNTQYMPKLEAASLCAIPISCIKTVYVCDRRGVFRVTALEEFA
ncbi:hypothetical protein D0812_07375 [Vibrio owensii]|uniref:Uncharacterized protein n=2 Tax=Vibrio TaxID=662 RepID=A0AAP9K9Z7_9VIBR|nr:MULTISPECIES: hypothetical protein [Vibrio]AYO14234.1 hypothetical protein D0812_07375 [Vibrio owensii]NAZ55677.1 hypothetical protein [Vibrio toranzoniae]QGH46900.1 hypothetical protein APZ19_07335 [Vibrio owensii]